MSKKIGKPLVLWGSALGVALGITACGGGESDANNQAASDQPALSARAKPAVLLLD